MRVFSVVKQMPPPLSLSIFFSVSLRFTHSLFLSQTAGKQSLILNQLLHAPHADVLNCRDGQLDPDTWFSFFDNLLPSSSFVPLFHSHISSAHISDNLWNMFFFFRVIKKKKRLGSCHLFFLLLLLILIHLFFFSLTPQMSAWCFCFPETETKGQCYLWECFFFFYPIAW